MADATGILARLDQAGYRATAPRRIVLEEIARRQIPFTSAELWRAIQTRDPPIGRATVFRTLDLLTRLGAVQRIHEDPSGGRCHAYLTCEPGHHHHLICRTCGAVADFAEGAALETLVRAIEQQTAFRVVGHRLELIGCCWACQTGEQAVLR